MPAQSPTAGRQRQSRPIRIRGRRHVVIELDAAGNEIAKLGMARSRLWARFQARHLPYAAVVEVDALEAAALARRKSFIVDEITFPQLARMARVSPSLMRHVVAGMIASRK